MLVMASSLIFNFVSSLLVWHSFDVKFNITPMSVAGWICDIIGSVWFLFGLAMMFFDLHLDEKRRLKEAILECNEELEADEDSAVSIYPNNEVEKENV